MKSYSEDHVNKLITFSGKTIQEQGDVEPMFIFHLKNGSQIVLQMQSEDMASQDTKNSRVMTARAVVGSIDDIIMVSFVTGAYGIAIDDELRVAFPGLSDGDISEQVREKYGNYQSSPYSNEMVLISGDSKEQSFTCQIGVTRANDDKIIRVAEACTQYQDLSQDKMLDQLMNSGLFAGVFQHGLRLRDMNMVLKEKLSEFPDKLTDVVSLEVDLLKTVCAMHMDIDLSDEWAKVTKNLINKLQGEIKKELTTSSFAIH